MDRVAEVSEGHVTVHPLDGPAEVVEAEVEPSKATASFASSLGVNNYMALPAGFPAAQGRPSLSRPLSPTTCLGR